MASTSRSHEKSNIVSVMPFSSGLSSVTLRGALYLYSFFNTASEKKGFSLKYYPRRKKKSGSKVDGLFKGTNKFNSVTAGFDSISGDPQVLEVAEGKLVRTVLGEECKMRVVHQSHRPRKTRLFHFRRLSRKTSTDQNFAIDFTTARRFSYAGTILD
jgi:hypothetical protein